MATEKQQPKTEETTQQNSGQNDAMVSIGGLWVNTSKSGEMYLSGYFGSARLYVFKNKNKQGSQPDYYMTVAPNNQKRESNGADDFEKAAAKDKAISNSDGGDDVPF